jgi:hypothetical protein
MQFANVLKVTTLAAWVKPEQQATPAGHVMAHARICKQTLSPEHAVSSLQQLSDPASWPAATHAAHDGDTTAIIVSACPHVVVASVGSTSNGESGGAPASTGPPPPPPPPPAYSTHAAS